MKIKTIFFLLVILSGSTLFAQDIKLPAVFTTGHPRLNVKKEDRQHVNEAIQLDSAAQKVFSQLKESVDQYVTKHQSDSTWIVSRLQMYWKTKSTNVFIKGGVYDHAEGEAPVATVRFPGTRDNVTVYGAPKLEDMLPYADDPRGVYLVNRSKPGQPMEWADIAKTGRTIEGINAQIMAMCSTAALLYWITNEEKYAKFAFDLFDTYMTGMYYRKLPVDITHGHHQTITGLSTFEVIQEANILTSITGAYDYLYDYIIVHAQQKMPLYAETMKRWADVQINNGVAFNNWDLIEARNVLNIGSVLEDNKQYADGKGREYYIDFILNKNAERQWSISKLLKEGYDGGTGLWYECPGYSQGVLGDFTSLVALFDRQFNHDILPDIPIVKKAVLAAAQYLFPNGYTSAFGDSHYGQLSVNPAMQLIANAQQHNKKEQEEVYTTYAKTLSDFYQRINPRMNTALPGGGRREGMGALLSQGGLTKLKEKIPAGKLEDYVTPVFYSPNVSYLALRNGIDPKNGLMVAMSGSKGNHQHAGGISMEMFGKGYMLGPESGIGTTYFQPDYAEYYSQFPAHNTVVVDGISAYPVMKSNHGFELKSAYPASMQKEGFFADVSFGELNFIEPETQSDQNRLTSIIRTSDTTGYYVDIFRSKRRDGKDKMHDYIYHDMGQELAVTDATGNALNLQPTPELAFGGGYLFAYDYFWDKKSVSTNQNINAVFKLDIPGQEQVQMNLWMKGEKDREIFAMKAPKSTSIDRIGLPKEIAELPMPTILVRQHGEAWTKPFVAVYEPTTSSQPVSIVSIASFTPANSAADFEGLIIEGKQGNNQFIFSGAASTKEIGYADKSFIGAYGVISEVQNELQYLFLGSGIKIAKAGYSIVSKTIPASAALEHKNKEWFITATQPVVFTVPAALFSGKTNIVISNKEIAGKKSVQNGMAILSFNVPACTRTKIIFK